MIEMNWKAEIRLLETQVRLIQSRIKSLKKAVDAEARRKANTLPPGNTKPK